MIALNFFEAHLFATDNADASEELYLSDRLFIVDNTHTRTVLSDDLFYDLSSETFKINDWKVYKGYNEISKIDFFTLVKNDELLKKSLDAERINRRKEKGSLT